MPRSSIGGIVQERGVSEDDLLDRSCLYRQALQSYLPIYGLLNSSNPTSLWIEELPHTFASRPLMFINLLVS